MRNRLARTGHQPFVTPQSNSPCHVRVLHAGELDFFSGSGAPRLKEKKEGKGRKRGEGGRKREKEGERGRKREKEERERGERGKGKRRKREKGRKREREKEGKGGPEGGRQGGTRTRARTPTATGGGIGRVFCRNLTMSRDTLEAAQTCLALPRWAGALEQRVPGAGDQCRTVPPACPRARHQHGRTSAASSPLAPSPVLATRRHRDSTSTEPRWRHRVAS